MRLAQLVGSARVAGRAIRVDVPDPLAFVAAWNDARVDDLLKSSGAALRRSRADDARRAMIMHRVGSLVIALALPCAGGAIVAGQDRPALVVSAAVPDAASGTLTITGGGFGNRPLVTLNLIPLTVQLALDRQIVAAAPLGVMPPGAYFLTVSRGPLPADTASIDVMLGGAAGPAAANARAEVPAFAADPRAGPIASSGAAAAASAATRPASGGDLLGGAADVAATVGDRTITVAELDAEWRRIDPATYVGVARRVHEMRHRIADRLIADALLAREAAARGLSTDALLAEELPKRTVPLPDSAVLSLYQQLGDDTRGASLDQMRPALRAWLARFTEPELARMNYVEELMRVSTRAEIRLAPPRIAVQRSATDVPLGPPSAPVEIVAFGDLRNGQYSVFAGTFNRVRETFGARVRFVFKPLPADDPESLATAAAGHCAHGQGKFWAFHDAVIRQAGPLGASGIGAVVKELGLDGAAFEACRVSNQARGAMFAAREEARRYDIHSSPSFLVNGRLAPVPPPFLPPFEFFTRLIEEELVGQTRR